MWNVRILAYVNRTPSPSLHKYLLLVRVTIILFTGLMLFENFCLFGRRGDTIPVSGNSLLIVGAAVKPYQFMVHSFRCLERYQESGDQHVISYWSPDLQARKQFFVRPTFCLRTSEMVPATFALLSTSHANCFPVRFVLNTSVWIIWAPRRKTLGISGLIRLLFNTQQTGNIVEHLYKSHYSFEDYVDSAKAFFCTN